MAPNPIRRGRLPTSLLAEDRIPHDEESGQDQGQGQADSPDVKGITPLLPRSPPVGRVGHLGHTGGDHGEDHVYAQEPIEGSAGGTEDHERSRSGSGGRGSR